MPRDGLLLGIDYSQPIGRVIPVLGVGGFIDAMERRAYILFTEDDEATFQMYEIDVLVMPNRRELYELPSVLGQDIISRWRTLHDPVAGELLGTVLSADATFRPSRPP